MTSACHLGASVSAALVCGVASWHEVQSGMVVMTSTGTSEMQLYTVLPCGSSGKWVLLLSPVDGGRNTAV